ncbi:preprotein translocase subunit SecB [Alphaproteobacteria bacterium]
MVHGSSLIFPFARSEIAEVTLKSGVTPVMIDPVDFGKVYEMYKQQQKE